MPVTNPIFKRLNNHIKRNFGAYITAKLKERGIKHKFVAEKIGIQPAYFHRVLKGQDFLVEDALYKLADVLGEDVESMLNTIYYSQNLGDYLTED